MEELWDSIQTFLNENRETSDEKTYNDLLEEFYQIPSYVERFKRAKEERAQ